VVLDAVQVGPGGGTLRVTKAESPLRGLSITVPAGALAGGSQWTVTELKEVRPALPPKTRQIGPAIRIRNGQGVADRPFALTLPVRLGPDSAVAAFLRDPDSGTFELLPVAARTDTSLVVLTRHFSASRMALPAGTASLRAAASGAPAAGEVEVILVGASLPDLQVEVRVGYRPGVDDWEFSNRSSLLAPNGYCAGMSIAAVYHYYARKSSHGALSGLYDEAPSFDSDNPGGIRLVSVIQDAIQWDVMQEEIIAQTLLATTAAHNQPAGGPSWTQLQMVTMALAMLVTERPQLIGIYMPNWQGGHSIVSQAVRSGELLVSDPNEPGVERALAFTPAGFTPFPFSQSVGAPVETYTDVFVLGMSAYIPVEEVAEAWSQLDAGTIGDAEFPALVTQFREQVALDTVWQAFTGAITTASSTLLLRTFCQACPKVRAAPADPDRAVTLVLNQVGNTVAGDPDDLVPAAAFPVAVGTTKLGLRQDGLLPANSQGQIRSAYIDFAWFEVVRVPFQLLRSRFQAILGQEVTWSVNNGGVGGPGSTYRWTFSGQAPPVETPFGTTSVVHRFPAIGVNRIKVELFDPAGKRLGVDSTSMVAAEGYHWRMECVELKSDAPHANFTAAQAAAYQRWITYATPLAASPHDGFLSLLTPTTFRSFAAFFTIAEPGQGATTKALPLFPADTIDSPKMVTRVYVGSAQEQPFGPAGIVRTVSGGVLDNIYGASTIVDNVFEISAQGWGRGLIRARINGFSRYVSLRYYARLIWEPNPAPAPPCTFGTGWP